VFDGENENANEKKTQIKEGMRCGCAEYVLLAEQREVVTRYRTKNPDSIFTLVAIDCKIKKQ
jgi:hypothetical protein